MFLPVPAAAQMYGPEYARCRAGSTVAVVECVAARTKAWDRRLNTSYKDLMSRSDAGQRAQLKAAQRLWIGYRDANCRFYGQGEGSIRQIDVAECMRAMTQQRTCEIEAANRAEGEPATDCR